MIRILEPGALTTVQDLGRPGHLRYGIPPSGPIDHMSFVTANRLAGNPDGAAGLECTVLGPRFVAEAPCAIAVTGAAMPVTINGAEAAAWTTLILNQGDVVKLGPARAGLRAYVAFSGGLDVPSVLGSRSTYVRGRLGGLDGRALRKDDRLALLSAPLPPVRRARARAIPAFDDEPEIRVVLGPQADRFTDDGLRTFLGSAYEMLPDRKSTRLNSSHSRASRMPSSA